MIAFISTIFPILVLLCIFCLGPHVFAPISSFNIASKTIKWTTGIIIASITMLLTMTFCRGLIPFLRPFQGERWIDSVQKWPEYLLNASLEQQGFVIASKISILIATSLLSLIMGTLGWPIPILEVFLCSIIGASMILNIPINWNALGIIGAIDLGQIILSIILSIFILKMLQSSIQTSKNPMESSFKFAQYYLPLIISICGVTIRISTRENYFSNGDGKVFTGINENGPWMTLMYDGIIFLLSYLVIFFLTKFITLPQLKIKIFTQVQQEILNYMTETEREEQQAKANRESRGLPTARGDSRSPGSIKSLEEDQQNVLSLMRADKVMGWISKIHVGFSLIFGILISLEPIFNQLAPLIAFNIAPLWWKWLPIISFCTFTLGIIILGRKNSDRIGIDLITLNPIAACSIEMASGFVMILAVILRFPISLLWIKILPCIAMEWMHKSTKSKLDRTGAIRLALIWMVSLILAVLFGGFFSYFTSYISLYKALKKVIEIK